MNNLHKFKDSSSIEHCDFHEDKDILEIKFTSGAVYHYPNCTRDHYEALKAASSPGKHFHTKIRGLKGTKVSG